MENFLSRIFDPRSIKLNLEAETKEAVFDELAEAIFSAHPECDQNAMLAAMWEREEKLTTGIAAGVAIPHAICKGLGNMAGAIGISKNGIEYGSLDNKPVHVVFMLAMCEGSKENHLRTLNLIFNLVKSEGLSLIKNAKSTQEVHTILSRFR